MGNYRFRLSDMMPNAWFYKLRDMSKLKNPSPNPNPTRKKLQSPSQYPRKSFYYSTDSTRMDRNLCNSPRNPRFSDTPFPCDPPRKSKRSKRKTIYMPSPRKIAPSGIGDPVWIKAADRDQKCFDSPEDDFLGSLSEFENDSDNDQRVSCSSATDIIIDVDETSYASISIESSSGSTLQYGFTEFDMTSEPDLPPIVTKPPPPPEKVNKPRRPSAARTGRKSVSGVRVRRNGRSKRPAETSRGPRKTEKKGMLFYSESFAIVKASVDPEKDFRESMTEMIVENNIRESKDLEELLACYLSLNSNQYHDLIIKAFEQIWFNMAKQGL